MRFSRVTDRHGLQEFIDLAPRLAAERGEEAHWVPLMAADIRAWHSDSGWFDEPVELWLLRDEADRPVARTICHRSPKLAARLRSAPDGSADALPAPGSDGPGAGPASAGSGGVRDTLFFGALDAHDPTALAELLARVRTSARNLGCRRVFGPVSPLPNVTGGLLTAGGEHPGFFDTAWNPGFFAPVLTAAGFVPWGPARTWEVRVDETPAARATAVTAEEWADHGLRRRRVSPLRLRAFARRLLPTLNSAFARLPYYTPISPAQLRAQMQGLAALLDPGLVIDVCGRDDGPDAPPRCFALVIPDPLPILRRHGGRLGPRAIAELLLNRHRLRDAVLIIQGTDPSHQGRGLLSLVNRDLNAALAAGGYHRMRVTFIAEDNPASAAVFAGSGGRPLHSLSFFDLDLGHPSDGEALRVEGGTGADGARGPG